MGQCSVMELRLRSFEADPSQSRFGLRQLPWVECHGVKASIPDPLQRVRQLPGSAQAVRLITVRTPASVSVPSALANTGCIPSRYAAVCVCLSGDVSFSGLGQQIRRRHGAGFYGFFTNHTNRRWVITNRRRNRTTYAISQVISHLACGGNQKENSECGILFFGVST